MSIDEVRALLERMNDEGRRAVFTMLREDFGISLHQLEKDWGIAAEKILEAIHAAPDLTQRGVRGVLAEAIFRSVVVPTLAGWRSIDIEGDFPYDLLLERDNGEDPLKIQVKNQRKDKGEPKINVPLTKKRGFPVYLVETQRTRTGKRTGEDGQTTATRPYRFGEFDVVAVCMQPSCGDWEDFIYCPTHRLLPRPKHPELLHTMQPIFTDGTGGWTRSLDDAAEAVYEHRSAAPQR
jgi:hypothetical protein